MMSIPVVARGEDIAIGWRTGASALEDPANPAGPLFVGGRFAASDLAAEPKLITWCGTMCTRISCADGGLSMHVNFCC